MSTDQYVNIASHLPTMAQQQPNALAVVVQEAHGSDIRYPQYTAKELEEESNRIANGLERIGITRGMRTVLMVTPGLDFFALTFALFKVGAPPAVIDPGKAFPLINGPRDIRENLITTLHKDAE